ncbi:global transactivator [Fusarium austroafricanum]|uniref:Global transactivator n=1 Tax=Fusarium austroafricanum TaxID=2364996 RepID=A0A8H4K3D7_9HYPO|nr:global transactivator [Fusarium austroafricanum]
MDEFYGEDGKPDVEYFLECLSVDRFEGEEEDVPGYDEGDFDKFIYGLVEIDVAKHVAPTPAGMPTLKGSFQPFRNQVQAVAAAIYMKTTPFKGMIIADPPGWGGKTLSALMTIAVATKNPKNTNGPCVVVAPTIIWFQWMNQIEKFFGQMPSICINEETNTSPDVDLSKYKIVVTSYAYVVSEVKRRNNFINKMAAYEKDKTRKLPQKPKLILLPDPSEEEPSKPMGEVLVLDDAHVIHSRSGEIFPAIGTFRDQFDFCLMMTRIPMEDSWKHAYPLFKML